VTDGHTPGGVAGATCGSRSLKHSTVTTADPGAWSGGLGDTVTLTSIGFGDSHLSSASRSSSRGPRSAKTASTAMGSVSCRTLTTTRS
jgi:hypothetical protein